MKKPGFSNFSQPVDSTTRLNPIQSALPSPRIEHLFFFFDFLVLYLEVGSGAKKGFALSKSMDTHTSWSRAMPMPLLFVSLFLLYLKLNYVEKVMKREIGNGFSDKATSSTWLAKSKKLKKWTCEFDFCIGKRHQQYISTISCFSMMFLCIWKCWSSFGLCFITR